MRFLLRPGAERPGWRLGRVLLPFPCLHTLAFLPLLNLFHRIFAEILSLEVLLTGVRLLLVQVRFSGGLQVLLGLKRAICLGPGWHALLQQARHVLLVRLVCADLRVVSYLGAVLLLIGVWAA